MSVQLRTILATLPTTIHALLTIAVHVGQACRQAGSWRSKQVADPPHLLPPDDILARRHLTQTLASYAHFRLFWMSPAVLAQNGLLSALLFSVVGVLLGWALWRVAQRGSTAALVGAWLAAAVLTSALMTMQIRRTQNALGFTEAQQALFPVFWWFLPMWVAGLGAVALVVRRRVRKGEGQFSAGAAAGSLGAFWLGVLAYLLLFAVLDITSIIR